MIDSAFAAVQQTADHSWLRALIESVSA